MPDEFKILIDLDDHTLGELGEYYLYGFKGVEAKNGGGLPAVWFKTKKGDFGRQIEILWTESYQAYWSDNEKITDKLKIKTSGAEDIKLSQYFDVHDNGTAEVNGGGPIGQVTIRNQGIKARTCGISQKAPDGSFSPLCVFPLHGQSRDAIIPKLSVLLIFESQLYETSTAFMQAFGKGLLIDLTNAPSGQRQVAYDIDKSWNWYQKPWASIINEEDPLDKALITINTALKT